MDLPASCQIPYESCYPTMDGINCILSAVGYFNNMNSKSFKTAVHSYYKEILFDALLITIEMIKLQY